MNMTVYEAVGGDDFFAELAHEFYVRVRTDEVLSEMYGDDLETSEEHLYLFLRQYWGGPDDYTRVRGPAGLRIRHLGYQIGEDARDHWLSCMSGALDAMNLPDTLRNVLWSYFSRAAEGLRNRSDSEDS